MRRAVTALVSAAVVSSVLALMSAGSGVAAAAGTPGQGVSATTIRIGVPYVDLSAVRKFGITLDQGNYPDAYSAIVADIDAHGGVDGRKLVVYLVAVNPVGTAPAATACTQLSSDDKVFVAIAPQQPDCFLQQYGVPTIAGNFQNITTSGGAPNFTLSPPLSAYDPVQLAAFAHKGVFKGKKVGLFAGQATDEHELGVVESTLRSLHVPVVQSAVDNAPPGDETATYQQAAIITQRFESSGVNQVVAVGTGSLIWPEALAANQASYHPPFVATSLSSLTTAVLANSIPPAYLRGLVASSPQPSNYRVWHTPAVQHCAQVVRQAYPDDKMTPPTNPISGSDQTFFSVESACVNLALFTTIAKAAGKDLTLASFERAGYGIRNATIPGAAAPVSFGPHRPYPVGPVIFITYDPQKNVLDYANSAASS